jgi:hypothetical protein
MKYEFIGEEVSVEGAVVQAAQALDFAGKYAQQDRNTEALLDVAASWTKVAEFIVALTDHDEKKNEDAKKSDVPFGIQPSKAEVDKPKDEPVEHEQLEITVEDEDEE